MIVFDTNIIIALFASEEGAAGKLAQADEFFVPSVVLGIVILAHTSRPGATKNSARY